MKSEKYKVYSYDGHENEQVVASFVIPFHGFLGIMDASASTQN